MTYNMLMGTFNLVHSLNLGLGLSLGVAVLVLVSFARLIKKIDSVSHLHCLKCL